MGGVSIAAGEVHAHCEVDLAAAHDVIEKRVHPTDLESMQYVIRNVCVCAFHGTMVCKLHGITDIFCLFVVLLHTRYNIALSCSLFNFS